MTSDPITLWFNPACSKCREAAGLLEAREVPFTRRVYLDEPPTRAELGALLEQLGSADPRAIMRTSDELFLASGLGAAAADRLLDALVAEPRLLQRPIAVRSGRAVVARPPSLLLELLGDDEIDRAPDA